MFKKPNTLLFAGIIVNWIYVSLLAYLNISNSEGVLQVLLVLWPLIGFALLAIHQVAKNGAGGGTAAKILFAFLVMLAIVSCFMLYLSFTLRHLSFGL